MKISIRWMLIAAVAVVVLVVLILSQGDAALEVEAARVVRGTLRVTVDEEGRTRVRERYQVAAPVTGRLGRIDLRAGDRVEEGMRVAQLYPVPAGPRDVSIARAQLSAAEAQLNEAGTRIEEAQANAYQAEREARRSQVLVADSILSQAEFERTELAAVRARQQLAAAQASRRAAEAGVQAARAALVGFNPQRASGEVVDVHAPSPGRVLRVLVQSERVVPAGALLIEIGDAEGLEAVIDVLSADAVRIRPGNPVFFEAWGGDEALAGQIRLVEPEAFTEVSALGVEEQRVNVVADLFDPPPALGLGYRVEARIVTWEGDDVLTVPTSALFQLDGTWQAFAIEGGEAVRRPLRIGHRATEAAEVLDGLEEGDTVILFPSDQIADGVRVQPGTG